jgi:hypothetical protein
VRQQLLRITKPEPLIISGFFMPLMFLPGGVPNAIFAFFAFLPPLNVIFPDSEPLLRISN